MRSALRSSASLSRVCLLEPEALAMLALRLFKHPVSISFLLTFPGYLDSESIRQFFGVATGSGCTGSGCLSATAQFYYLEDFINKARNVHFKISNLSLQVILRLRDAGI
jgi:hypothetical protein